MSWADDAANAKGGSDQAPYIEPGNYELETVYGRLVEKFKGGEMLVTRFKVLESDNPKFRPGDEMDWGVNIKNGTPWADNIKDFVSTVGSMPLDQVTSSRLLLLYPNKPDDGQHPLRGMKVRAEAWNRETQKGNPFTRVRWKKPTAKA